MKFNCKVNKSLLPGKISFFGIMSAALWTYPFMFLYFQDLGLSTTECSIIYGVLPLSNGLYKMIVGAVSDKFQRHRELTLISSLLSAVLMSLLVILPPVDDKQLEKPEWDGTLHYLCNKPGDHSTAPIECLVYNASKLHLLLGKSELDFHEWEKVKNDELNNRSDCSQVLNALLNVGVGCFNVTTRAENLNATENGVEMNTLTCRLDCTRYPQELLDPPQPEKERYGKTFWIAFWIWFTACNLQGSLWALFYGMIYAILGENREDFGKQRMWGTIGALTTSLLSGVAMNKYGSVTPEITYTPCFIGYAIWTVIIGITAMFFKVPHMTRNKTMTKDMLKLVKQPAISLLFVVVFVMGFLGGAADTFLFVFLRTLNASSFMFGVILFVKFFGEVPALYFSGRIMKRIGHIRCMYIVLFCKFVRFLGTSFITNPWWEVAFSAVSSVVFGIGFTAVSVYGSLITPPSMHATLQGTIQTIHFGLGKGIGILVSGPMIEAIGYRWGFRVASLIALVTVSTYMVLHQFIPPVNFVTHDEDKDEEVEKPLKREKEEMKEANQDMNTKKAIGDAKA